MIFDTQHPLDAHVSAVAATGVDPPPQWSALRERLDNYLSAPSPIITRLANALISDTDDVAILRAAALAEALALPPHHAQVDLAVKAAVLARLTDIYAPHAHPNYDRLAADFDATAAKFAAAANVIDPETPAEHLIHAQEKLRKAWNESERLAHRLTEQMTALAAAANLCGVGTAQQEQQLALVCDPAALHRRRVWEAWDIADGRTGRWSALVALGVVIRAHTLDTFEPYRRPLPMETRQIPVARGAVRFEQVDPEDAEKEKAVLVES